MSELARKTRFTVGFTHRDAFLLLVSCTFRIDTNSQPNFLGAPTLWNFSRHLKVNSTMKMGCEENSRKIDIWWTIRSAEGSEWVNVFNSNSTSSNISHLKTPPKMQLVITVRFFNRCNLNKKSMHVCWAQLRELRSVVRLKVRPLTKQNLTCQLYTRLT